MHVNANAGSRSGVRAWVAYDFINSILIINGSLHFSAWITGNQRVSSFWYGFTFSASTLLLLLVLPSLGAVIDRLRSGRQILLGISLLIGFLALLLPGIARSGNQLTKSVCALLVFGSINFLYQASLVAYNWLLMQLKGVRESSDVRRMSGWGEAAGNIGSVAGALLGAVVLRWIVLDEPNSRIDVIGVVAILYLVLFAIDYVALSKGIEIRGGSSSPESHGDLVRAAFAAVRARGPLRTFLLAFLFYADAILTVQLYLPIYMRERLMMSDSMVAIAFAVSLAAAGVGAWMFSVWSSGIQLRKLLLWCLGAWSVTLVGLGMVASVEVFVGIVIVAGVLFGVLWGASRAYLIELAPKEMLGRMFGFYAVFERCASVIGPLIWGAVMALGPLTLERRYQTAYVLMGLLVALGALILSSNKESTIAKGAQPRTG